MYVLDMDDWKDPTRRCRAHEYLTKELEVAENDEAAK